MTIAPFLSEVPITAIVYGVGEAVDPVLARLADRLSGDGVRLAGLVQRTGGASARCAMEVAVLPDGARRLLSEDRGSDARGCRLDHGLLVEALALAAAALPSAEILILNRFGKVEAEGGGGRDLMAEAVQRAIPVLVAVPWRNIAAFRAFVGPFACDVTLAEFEARLANLYSSPSSAGCQSEERIAQ